MEQRLEHSSAGQRVKTMLAVDFRRIFTTRFLYIMLGICLVMPVLILVMTTMLGDASIVDPTTGVETSMGTFTNTWQTIGSYSDAGMSMDLTSMCNINMLYFFLAVLVCVFVADDFRSGYAKNLFTVRAKKGDYVVSKTIVCSIGGSLMLLAFFVGAVLGGAIAGLPFDTGAAGVAGIVMCMIAKICLVPLFVSIFLAVSVTAKQKTWLSLILGFMAGMLLFMMIPMMTPLDATIMHVVMCLAGGALFSAGLGAVSKTVLAKTSLV